MSSIRAHRRVLLALYLLFVALSTALAIYRFHYLLQHHDFSLYLQFATKLLNPTLTNKYSMNVDGYNFLGLVVNEGELGFQRLIHVEAIKYLWAALHRLTGSPAVIFLSFSAIYYLPVLALSRWAAPRDRQHAVLLYAVALLTFFYPGSILASVNALRPRMLFNGVLPLVLLAIHFRRPAWQVVLAFLGLFALREEAALFSVPLLLFAFFQPGERAESRRLLRILIPLYSLYLLGLLLYYLPPGFRYDAAFNSFARLLDYRLAGTLLVIAAAAVGLWVLRLFSLLGRGEEHLPGWLRALSDWLQVDPGTLLYSAGRLGSLGLLFVPLVGQAYILINTKFYQLGIVETNARLAEAFERLFFTQQLAIFGPMLAISLLVVYDIFSGPRARRVIAAVAVVFCGLMITLASLRTIPTLFNAQYEAGYPPAGPARNDASIVFDLRERIDPHNDYILTDLRTLAAFYDVEDAVSFNFLPLRIAPLEERNYPESRRYLRPLLADEIDYITVHQVNADEIELLVSGLPIQLTILDQNDNFIVYQVVR